MRLEFVKMSGAGNDFIVIDGQTARSLGRGLGDWVRRVCRRGVSVGADGVLIVGDLAGDRVAVRFLNPDGSAAFCGNGSRCAARYAAHRMGQEAGLSLVLETIAGAVPARVDGERVTLTLEQPEDRGDVELEFDGRRYTGHRIHAGTPHLVVAVEEPERFRLERFGPRFRFDERFAPLGTNVDIFDVVGDRIRLRTWEKGVERETLACGSGAIAVAAVVRASTGGAAFEIEPRSGIPLTVRFGAEGLLEFVGDARRLFHAELNREATGPGASRASRNSAR